MTKTALYHYQRRLDEEKFAVAYSVMDYCLKLWQRGCTDIYAPRRGFTARSKARSYDVKWERQPAMSGKR